MTSYAIWQLWKEKRPIEEVLNPKVIIEKCEAIKARQEKENNASLLQMYDATPGRFGMESTSPGAAFASETKRPERREEKKEELRSYEELLREYFKGGEGSLDKLWIHLDLQNEVGFPLNPSLSIRIFNIYRGISD